MAHRYQQHFSLPENFHEMLKGFTREVLRDQPSNIYDYGLEYFTRLANLQESSSKSSVPHYYSDQPAVSVSASLLPSCDSDRTLAENKDSQSLTEEESNDRNEHEDSDLHEEETDHMDVDEIGDHLKEALMQVDVNENGFLGVEQVKRVISQFNLISPMKLLFLVSECCQLTDEALVEYIDFVDQAVGLLKTIDEYDFLNEDIEVGEEDLVHDLNAAELEEELRAVLSRSDEEQTGQIHIRDFIQELSEAELDLTKRELTMILCETPVDENGMVNYENVLHSMHTLIFVAQWIDDHMQQS